MRTTHLASSHDASDIGCPTSTRGCITSKAAWQSWDYQVRYWLCMRMTIGRVPWNLLPTKAQVQTQTLGSSSLNAAAPSPMPQNRAIAFPIAVATLASMLVCSGQPAAFRTGIQRWYVPHICASPVPICLATQMLVRRSCAYLALVCVYVTACLFHSLCIPNTARVCEHGARLLI